MTAVIAVDAVCKQQGESEVGRSSDHSSNTMDMIVLHIDINMFENSASGYYNSPPERDALIVQSRGSRDVGITPRRKETEDGIDAEEERQKI